MVLGVDDDDPKLDYYLKIAQNLNFIQLVRYPAGFFKEVGLSGLWNQMAKETTGKEGKEVDIHIKRSPFASGAFPGVRGR